MNVWSVTVGAGLVAYLLGAIPFGYIIARARGVDIRCVGSGNIGATNVWRCVGRGWGILTYVCDMGKGYVSAAVLPGVLQYFSTSQFSQNEVRGLRLLCGCLSVAGHNWPVTLGFKGGKGVATTLGALLGFAPLGLCVAIVVWPLVFLITRYVSVASISAVSAVAASAWFIYLKEGLLTPVALTILGAIGIWRHKSNLKRLWNGTEHRFTFGTTKKNKPQ
ncbi:MAG: glycerol-3-phosphate 1-O-acyltransferase PlsY [Kiritimatiellae bacterium]|nr:glycerol-3-phosphate 1-O-acyltransferase PlsY [Kiritimatiellia bacterium]